MTLARKSAADSEGTPRAAKNRIRDNVSANFAGGQTTRKGTWSLPRSLPQGGTDKKVTQVFVTLMGDHGHRLKNVSYVRALFQVVPVRYQNPLNRACVRMVEETDCRTVRILRRLLCKSTLPGDLLSLCNGYINDGLRILPVKKERGQT